MSEFLTTLFWLMAVIFVGVLVGLALAPFWPSIARLFEPTWSEDE